MDNFTHGTILPVNIEEEVQKSYIDYAMSVIVGRALPDVRDGLKPVHRRILYSMYKNGITSDKPHKKSAHVVGDVLAKYHPHGDSSVYEAMVRMAQDFSYRNMLVDGHGNFGSVDGDSAAAMRYTEVRMAKISAHMLSDIEKETIDYMPNYDESLEEPVSLPSRFPNLLVNGAAGIAVGMATNIPPHNLGEVIDGVVAMIDNPGISSADLVEIIKGPDFPTGGIILGRKGINDAYTTGRGSVKIRARSYIENLSNGKTRIVVTELPYQVNKARLIEKIAHLVRDKIVEGITDLRDESDRKGMRMVIELKRDVNPQLVLNQLYKHTQLQDFFGVIILAIVNGRPKILTLREVLFHYTAHQKDIIVRRTKFELRKAEDRAHILEGLRIALANIDEVVHTIKKSRTGEEAKQALISRFLLSEIQAQAILDMRLQRLTGLEIEKIEEEYNSLKKLIAELKAILADDDKIMEIIRREILEIKKKFADPRRTEITFSDDKLEAEDLIAEEDVVITVSHQGYIKRMPADAYKPQKRGGKGITAMSTKQEDFVESLFITTTHHYLMFFTTKGKVYRIKAYEIPEFRRQSKGTAIVNLLYLDKDEKITTIIPVKEFTDDHYLVAATENGQVKKTDLKKYDTSRRDGLLAVGLRDGDRLMGVQLTNGSEDIILVTRKGKAIRFHEQDVRPMGRTAVGVRGIDLAEEDIVVGMEVVNESSQLLVLTEKGFGKRTSFEEYRCQTRGGKGTTTLKITSKNGNIVAALAVRDGDEIMTITKNGFIQRTATDGISIFGRATQGVVITKLHDDDKAIGAAKYLAE